MSCGYMALERNNIQVTQYFSSETDKHANTLSQFIYPNIKQIGDVCSVFAKDLPKIDLLIGGSPCQGFSFAGKQLNFNDPRSKLFFEFVRIWREVRSINPDAKFLLENVNMKKEILNAISQELEVFPVRINSKLVSAQNRDRWYWTNIKTKKVGLFGDVYSDIPQPKDKGILLRDILDNGNTVIYDIYNHRPKRFYSTKGPTLRGERGGLKVTGGAIRGRPNEKGEHIQNLENNNLEKSNALTSVQKDSVLIHVGNADINGHDSIKRVYSDKGKAPCLTGMSGGNQEPKIAIREKSKTVRSSGRDSYDRHEWDSVDDLHWRKLTVKECARLQTIPENYIDKMLESGVSNSQLYKMLGNGWTVDVIAHIFSFLETRNN